MEACKTGNVGVVQLALERGADPNQANEVRLRIRLGTTPFVLGSGDWQVAVLRVVPLECKPQNV